MKTLIFIACIAATLYYIYLIAGFADIRAERKRMERRSRRGY
tara:strand:+ start:466 stop:591 length:126 start_codon:yes stop_codon:yes gene_type:complete